MAAWIWFGLFGALTNLAAIVLLLAALRTRLPERLELLQRRAVACAVIGTFGSGLAVLLGFVAAFGAIGGESVDPSQKARILAEGISEAMYCAAVGLLTAPLPIVALVGIAILARRAVAPRAE
jgi:biopolymer transport protein ExbB/TolQ